MSYFHNAILIKFIILYKSIHSINSSSDFYFRSICKNEEKMNEKTKNVLFLFLLASCWGPSFLFIKIAVEEVQPIMLAALRIGIGALILNIFLIIRGKRLPI